MRNKIKIVLVAVVLSFLVAPSVFAQVGPLPSLVPPECRGNQVPGVDPPCTLTSVETMAGNLATIILGVTGSLALLMFVIGGVQMILAGGIPKQYEKAKSTLTNALLGLILVIFAGALVKFLVKSLTGV